MSSISGGSGAKNFITNAGTAIAVNSTISIVGTGGVSTSASGNTVTITGSGVSVDTITGDSGGAISPSAGNINIFGGTGITTSGSGSTLTVSVTGTTNLTYRNVNTTPYVVLSTDEYISVDCSGAPIVLQFPNAATSGRSYIIKDRTGSSASNNITITTVGGAVNIDGSTTFVMNSAYQSAQIIGNGSTYEIY